MTTRRTLLFFGLAAGLPLLAAASPSAESADGRALLQSFLKLPALQGEFVQVSLDRAGRKTGEAFGTFSFLRPGGFEWRTLKPFRQSIVSNGKRLWLYDEDLMEVTVSDAADMLGQTPAALLLGGGYSLESEWKLVAAGAVEGFAAVDAVPKKESSFSRIRFIFDRKTGDPAEMDVTDSFANRMTISFKRLSHEPKSAESYDFVVPKGVDVIENSAR